MTFFLEIYFNILFLIFNQGKKFSKPELKSCIEEFEEKMNKFHIEKKEQEVTAKNAQNHQQKMASLENFMVSKKEVEESSESEVTEGKIILVIVGKV